MMTALIKEPEHPKLSVFDAKGREWVKGDFFWEWGKYAFEWDTLSFFLGPMRSTK
jgi:hypothetical protein